MMTRDNVLDIADRLDREREAARPLVAELRADFDGAWDAPVPDPWRTLGFVQELTTVAAEILEQNPRESAALAQFAVSIVTAVPRDRYPAVLVAKIEARAWKDLGTAHRYLSEYAAANRAYDAALRALAPHGALAHDAAAIELAKAVVASESGKLDEADRMIAACEPVLESFGDQRRLIQAAMLAAVVRYRRGDYAHARSGFEKALAVTAGSDDLHTIAATYQNLAMVCIALGDTAAAAAALVNARQIITELGMTIELWRINLALGGVLMSRGEYRQAIPLLQSVRQHFLGAGMVDEAGVAALDIVDCLVALDRRDEAIRLVTIVLAEFRAAGLDRALVALSYLRDLLRSKPVPARAVHHVREFVEEMRTNRTLVFAPLPE